MEKPQQCGLASAEPSDCGGLGSATRHTRIPSRCLVDQLFFPAGKALRSDGKGQAANSKSKRPGSGRTTHPRGTAHTGTT